MTSFHDEVDRDAHFKFQAFRREHPTAFVLNLRSPIDGMLHLCSCDHMGDTEWLPDDGGSLTRTKKVCSEITEELVSFAQQQGIRTRECQDCKP